MKKKSAVIYGSGIGSLTTPSHKLGLGVLFQHLKSLQTAKEQGKKSIIKQFATVGYNITSDDRNRIIANREPIWDRLVENASKLNVLNKDGSEYGPIHVEIFPSTEHGNYPYFHEALKEVEYRARAFNHLPEFAQSKDYSILQTAQFLNFLNEYGDLTKVGWSFDKKHPDLDESGLATLIKRGVRSEYFFDQFLKVLFPEANLNSTFVQGIRNPETGHQHVPYNLNGDNSLPNIEEKYTTYCGRIKHSEFYNQTQKQTNKLIVTPYEDLFGELDGEVEDKVDIIQETIFGGIES